MEFSEQHLDDIQARLGQQLETLAQYVDQWSIARDEIAEDDDASRFDNATNLLRQLQDLAKEKKKSLVPKGTRKSRLSASTRERIEDYKGTRSRKALTKGDEDDDELHELQQWQDEVNSWDLLRVLSSLQHSKNNKALKEKHAPKYKSHKYSPDTDLWTQFIFQEDSAREKKLVLEWLERCANEDQADVDAILQHYDESIGDGETSWSHGWLNTREKIKGHKRFTSTKGATPMKAASLKAKDSSAILVTQLDPDAPLRQDRKLETEDESHDHAFWVVCYDMFRRGMSWDQILTWCEERNEGWRAASLGAAQDLDRRESRLCLAGPYSGALWRRMCYKMAQNVGADRYERATYGLLAGDVASVEPVCQSWTDWLYVNYNAILLGSFEEWLKKHHPERFPSIVSQKHAIYHPMPQQTDDMDIDGMSTTQRIIGNNKFADKSRESVYLLQGALVGKSFDSFAANLGIAIAQVYEADEHSLLKPAPSRAQKHEYYQKCARDIDTIRVAVHALIVYQDLGFELSGEFVGFADNIILCYINYLRELRKYEAIPTYAKCLSDEDTINTALGRLLFDITEPAEQNQMVTLMDQADLDLVSILMQPYTYALYTLGIGPDQEDETPSIDTFHLVDPAGDRWAGWRIADRFANDRMAMMIENEDDALARSLNPAELRLVRTLKWFFMIQAPWGVVFSALTNVLEQLLRTNRFFAALAITKKVPVEEMSKHLTPLYFDDAMDVFELVTASPTPNGHTGNIEHDSNEEEVLAPANEDPAPADVPGTQEFDFKTQVEILKSQAKPTKELQDLCKAIAQLIEWRLIEINVSKGPQHPEAQEIASDALADVHRHMKPLLHNFMAPPFEGISDPDQESELLDSGTAMDLHHIKRAYLPSIILAYNGAITFASTILGPETLFSSLELANVLADEENKDLADTLVETGKMGDVVESLALSQRVMLRLNQDARSKAEEAPKKGRRGKVPRRKRSKLGLGKGDWKGESVEIWDVSGRA